MSAIKRCLAIHDLAGFGRISLTVAIPVLSAMGIQACPIPTAVLSTHTGGKFTGYSFQDLTDLMKDTFRHWKELDLTMDAVYSGFLGSPAQCAVVSEMMDYYKKRGALVVVDPVLGDRGTFYASVSSQMAEEMRQIVAHADVLTPNMTEMYLLLDEPFKKDPSEEELHKLIAKLAEWGPKKIVVTSVPSVEGEVACLIYEDGEFSRISQPYMSGEYQGTGDLYSSILTGLLMTGKDFRTANAGAAKSVMDLIALSYDSGEPIQDGVLLEAYMPELMKMAKN